MICEVVWVWGRGEFALRWLKPTAIYDKHTTQNSHPTLNAKR
jgi:hypothetical protein